MSVQYLESYVESSGTLPTELTRILQTIKSLDERVQELSAEVQGKVNQLLSLAPAHSQPQPYTEYDQLIASVAASQKLLVQFAEEKVQLAHQAHALLEVHALELERVTDDLDKELLSKSKGGNDSSLDFLQDYQVDLSRGRTPRLDDFNMSLQQELSLPAPTPVQPQPTPLPTQSLATPAPSVQPAVPPATQYAAAPAPAPVAPPASAPRKALATVASKGKRPREEEGQPGSTVPTPTASGAGGGLPQPSIKRKAPTPSLHLAGQVGLVHEPCLYRSSSGDGAYLPAEGTRAPRAGVGVLRSGWRRAARALITALLEAAAHRSAPAPPCAPSSRARE
jgi:hypothetical protein